MRFLFIYLFPKTVWFAGHNERPWHRVVCLNPFKVKSSIKSSRQEFFNFMQASYAQYKELHKKSADSVIWNVIRTTVIFSKLEAYDDENCRSYYRYYV